MPEHDLHTQQRKKNLALLFVLLGLIAILFVMTIIRVKAPHI